MSDEPQLPTPVSEPSSWYQLLEHILAYWAWNG